MCVMDGGTLRGNYNYIAYDNSCIGCEILNITVQMGSSAIIRIIHPSHTLVLLLKVLCCISHT